MLRISGLILTITVMTIISPIYASIVNVPVDQPTIQAGIDAAIPGDTVLVHDGTYTGDGNWRVVISNKTLTLLSLNGPTVTTIDFQGYIDGETGFKIDKSNVDIQGFTLSKGLFQVDDRAIFCDSSILAIEECRFLDNYTWNTDNNGGAILCNNSTMHIKNSEFQRNEIDGAFSWTPEPPVGNGGAIASFNSTFKLENCLFNQNVAHYSEGIWASGGSLYAEDCDGEVIGCSFMNGIAARTYNNSWGSAIAWQSNSDPLNSLIIKKSLFAYNNGYPVVTDNSSSISIECTDIYGNSMGDWIGPIADQANLNNNFSADPHFCDTAGGDFHISSGSPCAPAYSSCGVLIGALDVACAYSGPVWHVSTTGDDVTGDGFELNPFATIQKGVDMAQEGDTVMVHDGTYNGVGNDWIDFHGKNIVVKSANGAQTTILEGASNPSDVFVMAFRLSNGEDQTSVIEGFEIREFNVAGIQCYGASPTVKNCNFFNNVSLAPSGGLGGAVFLSNCESPVFLDCIFANNKGIAAYIAFGGGAAFPSKGGAIYAFNSNVSLIGCNFSQNEAKDFEISDEPLAEGEGGSIYAEDCNLEIDACLFAQDSASYGGTAFLMNSPTTMTDCDFNDNYARVKGGAICLQNSNLEILGCNFIGNYAGEKPTSGSYDPGFGGAISTANSDLNISGSLFDKNVAADGIIDQIYNYIPLAGIGGAIVCENNLSLLINECTFVRNRASSARVLNISSAEDEISNSIFAYNQTGDLPGEVIECGNTQNPTLICCNLYGNSSYDWWQCLSGLENINGNFSSNPLFCDTASGDFQISVNSICAPANNSCGTLIGALGVNCNINFNYICGDINLDDTVNIDDILLFINYYFADGSAPVSLYTRDLNCDGKAGITDIVFLNNLLFGGGAGGCCP